MRVKSYIVRLLCMTSLVCLSVGPVALLYICTALLRSEQVSSLYEPTSCDVINMTTVSEMCHCGNQSHGCTMRQHCVEVKVIAKVKTKVNTVLLRHRLPTSKDSDVRGSNYTLCTMKSCDDEHKNGSRSYLDTHLAAQQCTLGPCDPRSANSTHSTMEELLETLNVTSIRDNGTSRRENMTCYINPDDMSHAVWRVREDDGRVLSGLVWPLVTIAVGLFFSILARICTGGKD